MSVSTILIILLVLCGRCDPALGAQRSWGYLPSGALGTILIIVVILLLMGRI